MKHLIPALFKLVAVGALFGCAGCNQSGSAVGESRRQTTQAVVGTNASPITLEQRRLLSQGERLRLLERNGMVPEDADDLDWQMAQHTSWWGKPIDPKLFWTGKVVWLSTSARKTARRQGRFYPPIPHDDEKMANLSADNVSAAPRGVEGPYLNYRQSQRETAFWDHFSKTHPKPPEEIEREQRDAAKDFYGTRTLTGLSSDDVTDLKTSIRNGPISRNYPAEAFTEEALYGSYFVTEPLTELQLKTAGAWKISYLQRLRREKVDETYINAYLKAWNLTPAQVFGAN